MSEMRRMTYKEWTDRAVELFGPDTDNWRFRCPACGNVASVGDFRPFKDKGATPDSAFQACIGRFDGHMNVDMGSGKPCNYAGFGLFRLQKTEVISEDGKPVRVFEFDDGGD